MDIKKEWLEHAKVNEEKYSSMYDHSLQNNDEFWAEQAERIDWIKKFTKIKDIKYSKDDVSIKWFEDGNLNNLQRHSNKCIKSSKCIEKNWSKKR
jgi:acetyl-CoA synthetase